MHWTFRFVFAATATVLCAASPEAAGACVTLPSSGTTSHDSSITTEGGLGGFPPRGMSAESEGNFALDETSTQDTLGAPLNPARRRCNFLSRRLLRY
ncbi:unnamed protein product [Amoebophrya sp. A25]|nr:unnamed protein product [Amoebophrya sp. A25]|eukprot:GSA25T00000022001.1